MLSLVTPRYFETIDRAKETSLRHSLIHMRDAIDKYYGDTGAYPETLDDLVSRRYLRSVPVDPITDRSDSWILIPPADPQIKGNIYDVHSGSEKVAEDGSSYAEW
jgi:general secretion pathway protein G